MTRIKIGRRTLNRDVFALPYVVAEIGVNHEGSIERAKSMIEEVSRAGGDAVKFQAYRAETLASRQSPAYWDTSKERARSQYELFSRYDKFWKRDFEELADYANSYKIDFLCTPFDFESADFLEPIVPAFKIASADITYKDFLKHIAKKGKPIIMSTGASSNHEILRALDWIEEEGNSQIILQHCVLNYPTRYKDANLRRITTLLKLFPTNIIGYSDHTLSNRILDILIPAWISGAQVLEKHYTWNKRLPGNDHYHAMDAQDLAILMKRMRFILGVMGDGEQRYRKNELLSRAFARRSIVARKSIPKGRTIRREDVTCKRPGSGIPPYMVDNVVGGCALDRIEKDEILTFEKIRMKSQPECS